jgi:hypothetical protein
MSPEASASIHATLPLADFPSGPLFRADDCPEACSNVTPPAASLNFSFILSFAPPTPDNGCDVEVSKWMRAAAAKAL